MKDVALITLRGMCRVDWEYHRELDREAQAVLRHPYLEQGCDHRKPVVIVAYSLGCQLFSSYL